MTELFFALSRLAVRCGRGFVRLALMFIALAAGGCSGSGDAHGTIVELSHTPAHRANVEVDDYTLLCVPGSNGSVTCTQMYAGSHYEEQSFPAQWNAELVSCGHDARCDREVVDITREQYNAWSIGDYYPTVKNSVGIRSQER